MGRPPAGVGQGDHAGEHERPHAGRRDHGVGPVTGGPAEQAPTASGSETQARARRAAATRVHGRAARLAPLVSTASGGIRPCGRPSLPGAPASPQSEQQQQADGREAAHQRQRGTGPAARSPWRRRPRCRPARTKPWRQPSRTTGRSSFAVRVRSSPGLAALGDDPATDSDTTSTRSHLRGASATRPLGVGPSRGAPAPGRRPVGLRPRLVTANPAGLATRMRCSPAAGRRDLVAARDHLEVAPVTDVLERAAASGSRHRARPPTSTVGPNPHAVPVAVSGSGWCCRSSIPSTSSSEMPTPSAPAGHRAP